MLTGKLLCVNELVNLYVTWEYYQVKLRGEVDRIGR